MKTRLMDQKLAVKNLSPADWDALASKAAKAAAGIGDQRSNLIKKAIQGGRSEKVLRSYGILSEIDIVREFPVPEP
jgi:hypothetical protein